MAFHTGIKATTDRLISHALYQLSYSYSLLWIKIQLVAPVVTVIEDDRGLDHPVEDRPEKGENAMDTDKAGLLKRKFESKCIGSFFSLETALKLPLTFLQQEMVECRCFKIKFTDLVKYIMGG